MEDTPTRVVPGVSKEEMRGRFIVSKPGVTHWHLCFRCRLVWTHALPKSAERNQARMRREHQCPKCWTVVTRHALYSEVKEILCLT